MSVTLQRDGARRADQADALSGPGPQREREEQHTRQTGLEQLRLEFPTEERYVLDGDREELRTIRHELATLRAQSGLPDAPLPSALLDVPHKGSSAPASEQPSALPDSAVAML